MDDPPGPRPAASPVPVSAVVPCFRCGATIGRAVASIAAQTAPPRELILVDDASGDDTAERLRGIAAGYPPGWVRVVALPANVGAGGARNAGWDAAREPYVAFLDSDDAWHERKLEIQHAWMREHRGVVLSGHPSARLDRGRTPPALPEGVAAARVAPGRLLLSNCFSTRSVMVRRELGVRFPAVRYMEDYAWLLEVVFSGHDIYRIEAPLAYTFKADYGAGGLSARLWDMEKGELRAYWALERRRRIGTLLASCLTLYSLLKFARRAAIAAARS